MRTLLILPLALVTVCSGTPTNPTPVTVRALDLAQRYRDDAATASRAFDGKPVLLALTNPIVQGSELDWHLTTSNAPAVVVCRFAGSVPPSARVVWIAGTCRGKVKDGRAREFGYDFYVLVTDCRLAEPPTIPPR